jgi:hypothetical protein
MSNRVLNKLNRSSQLRRTTVIALILGGFAFLASLASAQTNSSRPAPGRYLFIVETSHSMGRRSDGVTKTVANLLFTGMNGQIRTGDSIGIWTYNQELYTGRLPLQRWSSMEQRQIGAAILTFLKDQKYEKQPAFSSLRPAFDKLVKDSESITVILVTSGDETMTGTPFDEQINQLYKTWHDEQQKARMPFVTVLRAKHGTTIGYSVTPSPWQVEMPAWPAEPVVKAAPQPARPPKVQPSTVPPLIVTGKKPKSVEPANSSEIVVTAGDNAPVNTVAPAPEPVINAPVGSTTSEPVRIVSQRPPPNSAQEAAVFERKAEKPLETPQSPIEAPPTPSMVTNSIAKSEATSPAIANNSNSSNPALIESAQKSGPRQSGSAGVAALGNGAFSNKFVWIGGVALLGLACAILFMLSRRPHPEHISLISHSLEREKR